MQGSDLLPDISDGILREFSVEGGRPEELRKFL